jgi:EpsI family protein
LPDFLRSKPAILITAILLGQTMLLFASIRPEVIPASRPLAEVPSAVDSWKMVREYPIEAEVQEVLKADDTLNRMYVSGTMGVNLFVASFKSQRNGKAPHSPKNCLPGSGWLPVSSGTATLDVGRSEPINVNRYVISYGNERSLVLYWYQSRDRVVADEFKAKFYVMYDAMRLNRTDTALVRVIVPVVDKNDEAAEKVAEQFVKSFYGTVTNYLPS